MFSIMVIDIGSMTVPRLLSGEKGEHLRVTSLTYLTP